MRHGTTVRVVPEGVYISSPRLKTIGVYHDSISWGVWLPPDQETASTLPDLLLTSIHPDSWPFIFRLTLRLRDDVGAMAAAAKALRDQGINILSARSSVSGHHHATWNLIGEALDLRGEYRNKGWTFTQSPAGDRDNVAVEIARSLLAKLDSISSALDDFPPPHPFLHPRFLEKQLLSFPKEKIGTELWGNDELWLRIGDQRSRAIVFSVLPVLTFLWREGVTTLRGNGRSARPLQFIFDDIREIFKSDRRFFADLTYIEAEVPGIAAASFDTDEHFLRFRFFRTEERQRLYNFDLDYRHHISQENGSTRGLIEEFSDHLGTREVNLVQISNSIRGQDSGDETGGLRFIGMLSQEPSARLADDIRITLERRLRERFAGLDVERLEVRPVTSGSIFLSRHEDLTRVALLDIIRRGVRAYGLNTEEAKTVSGVTQNALNLLRSCAGIIQVYGKREGDNEDVQWLVGEYAAAVALGLPALRIVDLAVRASHQWKEFLRWDQDQVLLSYNSSWDDRRIEAELAEGLKIFLESVRERVRLPRAAG